MSYHISTTLIWDNFKKQSECPLCDIYREVEERILEQFQGEAVMIDEYRARVNKEGFCDKHFNMLLACENKLGTALQARTRLDYIRKHLPKITSAKQAAKAAPEIESHTDSCVICTLIEDNMQRYYKTVAQLYANDENFQRLLNISKGFCLHHFAELLKNASSAKSSADFYAAKLKTIEGAAIDRILSELDGFCDRFDYRNKDKPLGTERDSPQRAINKIHGEK